MSFFAMDREAFARMRKRLSSRVSPACVSVMRFLVIEAAWAPTTWRGVEISRGQIVASNRRIQDETGLTEKTVRSCLLVLRKAGEIEVCPAIKSRVEVANQVAGEVAGEVAGFASLITVCNYDTYDALRTQSGKVSGEVSGEASGNRQEVGEEVQPKNHSVVAPAVAVEITTPPTLLGGSSGVSTEITPTQSTLLPAPPEPAATAAKKTNGHAIAPQAPIRKAPARAPAAVPRQPDCHDRMAEKLAGEFYAGTPVPPSKLDISAMRCLLVDQHLKPSMIRHMVTVLDLNNERTYWSSPASFLRNVGKSSTPVWRRLLEKYALDVQKGYGNSYSSDAEDDDDYASGGEEDVPAADPGLRFTVVSRQG